MIIPGDIGTLIDFFGFTSSIFYCAAMVALIVMRFTKKDEHRPIKVVTVFSNLVEVRWLMPIWIDLGTDRYSHYCDDHLCLSSRWTNRCCSASAIFLCTTFYTCWSYILRAIRLLQKDSPGNE